MSKFSACAAALIISLALSAQTIKKDSEQPVDSASIIREMMDLLADFKPVSFVTIDFTLGNRLYSVRNRGLNAKQAEVSLMIYTPTIGYFHKSGFNFTAGANFLNDPAKGFINSQSSLSGGYDLTGNKNFAAGISYTHYFVKDSYAGYASPVQNDLYASFSYKKSWINPGVAFGYSTGYYNSVKRSDTAINNIRRRLYDSATFNLKAFSAIATISHQFTWYALFGKEDGLVFTPSFVINFGSSNTNISHNTNATNLLNFLNKRGKLPKLLTTSFQAESAGISINLVYSTGKFSFEPQWYIDYYLPNTSANRLTQVATFTAAYSF